MAEKHFAEVDGGKPFCSGMPDTTMDKDRVTCRKCLVRMGLKQSPRGWRKSRARKIAGAIQGKIMALFGKPA